MNKTDEDVDAVFWPKVAGAVALDEATKNEDLDFLVLFSSIAAIAGNAGQADYAGANSFLDAFAEYRTGLEQRGLRRGKTVSINWCAWKEGGMKQDESIQRYLRDSIGLEPLENREALAVFDRALRIEGGQVIVVKGAANALELALEQPVQPQPQPTAQTELQGRHWAECAPDVAEIKARIKRIFCEVTQNPEAKLDDDASYKEFGVDSLMAMKLTRRLENDFGKIPQTLLYECLTINELCDFFAAYKIQDSRTEAIERGEHVAASVTT